MDSNSYWPTKGRGIKKGDVVVTPLGGERVAFMGFHWIEFRRLVLFVMTMMLMVVVHLSCLFKKLIVAESWGRIDEPSVSRLLGREERSPGARVGTFLFVDFFGRPFDYFEIRRSIHSVPSHVFHLFKH